MTLTEDQTMVAMGCTKAIIEVIDQSCEQKAAGDVLLQVVALLQQAYELSCEDPPSEASKEAFMSMLTGRVM